MRKYRSLVLHLLISSPPSSYTINSRVGSVSLTLAQRVIAALSEFERLAEGTTHGFGKEASFYEMFVKIGQYAAVF